MATIALRVRQQPRHWVPPVVRRPTFLEETAEGFLHLAWRRGTEIHYGYSINAGANFSDGTLAQDAATGNQVGDPGAVPYLHRDRRDHLFLWYHTGGSVAWGWRSQNLGASWQVQAGRAGMRWPCGLCLPECQYLIGREGSAYALYRSEDYWQTLAPVRTFASSTLGQCHLRQDRRGWMHLLLPDGNHYWSADGVQWQAGAGVTGDHPMLWIGVASALVSCWQGTTLEIHELDDALTGEVAVHRATLPLYAKSHIGLLTDRRGYERLAGWKGGRVRTHYAGWLGSLWEEPR